MFACSFNPVFVPDRVVEDDPKTKAIKKINQYALIEKIGYGGNSRVFLALDTETQIHYAVKAIYVNDRNTQGSCLQREIRILRQLDHPNIVKLKEVLHSKRRQMVYIILEWASFGSLQDLIGSASLSEQTIATIFCHVCQGLRYLHGKGIVHHDIKPMNILLFRKGVAKLADFGVGHSLESTESMVGSPAYQAPEFLSDDSDLVIDPVKEDVWSLGVSLYETAFGRLPFEGENVYEIARMVRNSELTIPAKASGELRELLLGMLEPNPDKRMNLEQVMEHRWFEQAEQNFWLPVPPREVPGFHPSRSMVKIEAKVCPEDYSFGGALRSSSWSGLQNEL